jgi:hypothetical protein
MALSTKYVTRVILQRTENLSFSFLLRKNRQDLEANLVDLLERNGQREKQIVAPQKLPKIQLRLYRLKPPESYRVNPLSRAATA